MKLEETLNGGFNGLYGEVVIADSYKLRQLRFAPDVVIDLGANVGVFTRYARELWPDAMIVAVEPDKENYGHLVEFTNNGAILLNKGIGIGVLKKRMDEGSLVNGSHFSFVSENSIEDQIYDTNTTGVKSVMLDELFKEFVHPKDKVLVKIDVEGAEFHIFEHEPSLKYLHKAEYFAIELHHKNDDFEQWQKDEKLKALEEFMARFEKTHSLVYEHPLLFATKK